MKRDPAIDYLRSGITLLVVAHHAALAYNTFSRFDSAQYMRSTAPIVDAARCAPLDVLVAWNDMYFMALMFFISGLFVLPSLIRKGTKQFMTDRAKRLGIPYLVAVTVLSPLAYYPSWLLSDAAGSGHFLRRFFTVDGWSGGPAWYIWVLLAFCAVAAGAYRCAPKCVSRFAWAAGSSWRLAGLFLLVSLLTTLPMRLFITAGDWINLPGPLTFQTWRILLYFAWFLLGAALGNADLEQSLSRANLRPWPVWLAAGFVLYVAHAWVEVKGAALFPYSTRSVSLLLAALYSGSCTFTGLAAIGLARQYFRKTWVFADSFSANAYGIYLFHYLFITWVQFGLLDVSLPAFSKFLITLLAALAGSWGLTALLRKTAAGRIL